MITFFIALVVLFIIAGTYTAIARLISKDEVVKVEYVDNLRAAKDAHASSAVTKHS